MNENNLVREYLIEEINRNEVSVTELAEFKEIEVMGIDKNESVSVEEIEVEEGALIKKFVCGEVDLPDSYTKLEAEEEDDLEDATEDTETDFGNEQIPCSSTSADAKIKAKIENSYQTNEVCVSGRQPRMRNNSTSGSTVRRRSLLSSALQGLMGQANLSYARGQIEIAEKICLEIVRQNPLAPEPFVTLAEIYETRDSEKSLNFLTIAAHLNPHDRDQWIRIAEMYIAKGNYQQARVFYSKAIKVLPKDYNLRLRKAKVLEQLGERHIAKFTYLKMIPHVPPEYADLCLDTARSVAHHFHNISKPILALEAMSSAYEVCGKKFSLEDLNLYMELLILNKSYINVLKCLRERTSLEFETRKENNLDVIISCSIPDDFLPDFRTKLCVSLIHLNACHLFSYLIQNIHEHIPLVQERLELYIDVAEALMQEHKYSDAIDLLRPIVDTESSNTDGENMMECPAFVWLRQAECLRHLNRIDEAIKTYTRVVELAPFCYDAKFTLSALLKQQGRNFEAVKALEQTGEDSDGQPLNARLLYERCLMLRQIDEIDDFLETGYMLLGRHSIKLRSREEMLAAASGGSFYNAEGLKVILQMRNISEDTDALQESIRAPHSETSDLTTQDEYALFIELIQTAYKLKKYSYIERLCFAMVTAKRFVRYDSYLERIIILGCYFNDDCNIAFSYLRELISKNPQNLALWNLMSLLVQKGQDLRYKRYIRRLAERHPGTANHMKLFLAHYHLYCSSFKYALIIYAPMFKMSQDPLIGLCIAVVFSQLALQKKVMRKTGAMSQAIVFAHKYAEARSGKNWTLDHCDAQEKFEVCAAEQEICYNIGRIYHQFGAMHLAMAYYKRGLAASHPLIESNSEQLSLQQEIAYNLHLIYRASGNLRKARQCLFDYCVV